MRCLLLLVICTAWLIMHSLAPLVVRAAEQRQRHPLPAECMQPEQGHCFLGHMDFGEEGDRSTRNQSLLLVYEDGRPLGPPRSVHADIRRLGAGRYSHWTRETLYFSASDNSDPRMNGRTYEVASSNPSSTLGGLDRFPAMPRQHVEEITSSEHEYTIAVGGTLDMDNTRTLTTNNCYITFQNNVALTIENTGEKPVVNPRLVINDRGNWYTFESLLEEFTRGASTDQDKALFIWQHMRQNLYHETPLFGNHQPHDPVRLFNVFGFNLCDDAGNAGCSLLHHAGLKESKNRALHGHVQCEAMVDGAHQFLDVDMDCFYLDRENERPVSGDACARDHDLVRRELNYGQVVDQFRSSDAPAALFGPDDRQFKAYLRGHEIAYTLRPGEKVVFRWDNVGKYCAESDRWAHRPKYFGNSKFVYDPRLTLAAIERDTEAAEHVVEATAAGRGARLAGGCAEAHLDYAVRTPYPSCGGAARARFFGLTEGDRFAISLSHDGENWNTLWTAAGPGEHLAEVALDEALDVLNEPAKYEYLLRIGLSSASERCGANLCSLSFETDVLAAPASLPRLVCGTNRVRYRDATSSPHAVRLKHEWRETSAVQPPRPPASPHVPPPNAELRSSLVTFSWQPVEGADRYHLQVSRRPDFALPYRPSLDVIIPTTTWSVPYTGVFSPDTSYHWRLRSRNRWGVWGNWSDGSAFTWHGPRVPVQLRFEPAGETITLHWQANPRGARPVKYELYGSDQRGFSIHKQPHHVPGRGEVPGNYLGETELTSMVVVSPGLRDANANRVYYRVVALDEHGTASGCSDYVEFPHPFVYSAPQREAHVGQPYAHQVLSLRSLGDYQCRQNPEPRDKQYAYRFWDVEQNAYRLVEGPTWLTMDPQSGILSGTPSAAAVGAAAVKIEVTNSRDSRAEQQYDLLVTGDPSPDDAESSP